MDPRTASLLAAIKVLSQDAAGGVVLHDSGGAAVPCEVVPPLGQALDAAAGGPVVVRVNAADGKTDAIVVLAAPGVAGAALALDERAVDGALGGALASLVNQIAHDVRNHAFTIGLQSEMGARRSAAAPEVRAHFEAVLRQVDALKHYLEQLLLFGRPAILAPIPLAVDAFAREQVQRYRLAWNPGAPPLSMRVEVAGEIRQAVWDPRALGNALQALLDNAARSATPPPPVVVSVRAEVEGAVIEVRDDGDGIAPELLTRIAVPMSVRRAGGAGLGLAIARKMVEAHHGQLELESGPDGTTARMRLPWEASAD